MIGKEGEYLSVLLDPISDGRPAVRDGMGGHQSPSYLPVILGAGVIDNSRSHQEWIEEAYRDAVLSGGVECARYGITRDGGHEVRLLRVDRRKPGRVPEMWISKFDVG
jgi:hypothetical protein